MVQETGPSGAVSRQKINHDEITLDTEYRWRRDSWIVPDYTVSSELGSESSSGRMFISANSAMLA